MTRDEHLKWCKQRALEYILAGDMENARASMLSDLGKHKETAGVVQMGFLLSMGIENLHDMRRWIEGFN